MLLVVGMQAATAKVQEMTTKAQENASGKMTESDMQSMHSRTDAITYAVLAEVQHFEQYRINDFRDYMTRYLQGQIEFYRTASVSLSATSTRPNRTVFDKTDCRSNQNQITFICFSSLYS